MSLAPNVLYKACDPDEFPFRTTAELDDIDINLGQERASEALQFGLRIKGSGYNLYALGPTGTGKFSTVEQVVKQIAKDRPPAFDWCYVNNFVTPYQPIALQFPAGRGAQFRLDMEHLINDVSAAIPAAFESEEYRTRAEELEEELHQRQTDTLTELQAEARKNHIEMLKTPGGFAFAPKDKKDEVLNPEDFNKLSEGERKQLKEDVEKLQEKLKKLLGQFPIWRKETLEKIKAFEHEIALSAISPLVDILKRRYEDLSEVFDYLNEVEKDIIEHVQDFQPQSEESPLFMFGRASRGQVLQRYKINLLVDNSENEVAPVIFENIPSHGNLIGRCEYQSQMGALVTDFTLIKPGALHKANGGYLILEARKLLQQPYAWESLKRTLEAETIRIESLERSFGLISTVALEPEPIPLDIKVILIGERLLYYLLDQYDPDFPALFKVAADFEDAMERSKENNLLYARMIGTLARKTQLRPLEKTAVIRLIEHSSRLASDAEKLTTHMRSMTDLLREADHWAEQAGHSDITAGDIQQAIDKQIYRVDRIRERINEEIRRGTILIDTEGETVGQVNGLSVIQLGNFAFGKPSRITATMRMGEGKVIDIERETELGGAIHSKGVLILSSFLSSHYSKDEPLSMTASIVFEQSYSGVEGDSASLAELCALLSALANVPIRQSLAMTGSVNQHGQVQPIGGVNEKIEGFFDICSAFGLTGKQGVLIPERNVKHLMLRPDVIQAVADGKFHIHAVETVNQALELLTGMQAGEKDDKGMFPEGSVNYLVEKQLLEFAALRRRYAHADDENGDNHNAG